MKKLWKEILATFVLFIGEAHSQNSINTGVTSSLPESCFKYLKEVLGRDDVASEKYSLKIKEAGSFEHKGKKIPIFGLRAYDLPKNRPFKILNRNAIGCTYKIFEGFVSKDNKLIHGGDSVPFLSIYLGGFAVGEPTQFLLVDKETGTTDSVNYLPYSMTPKITKSFKVTPYYISAKPPGYFFDIERLKPFEKITTISGREETQEMTHFATVNGNTSTLLICMDKEEAMHNLHFEVRSKTDTAVMDFPWNNRGKELPIPLVVFTVNRNPTEQEYEAAVEQYRKRISQVEKSR